MAIRVMATWLSTSGSVLNSVMGVSVANGVGKIDTEMTLSLRPAFRGGKAAGLESLWGRGVSDGPGPKPGQRVKTPKGKTMAGHSQFKNIMFRKGKQDKERSKLFAKLSREITVAAKSGLPDPAHNPRLRTAIIAAKQESMPKDNIQRAIAKATGGDAENYDEIRYEGRGPGGTAIIVQALTDNRNRTSADVRSTFSKYGGTMGETNSVAFLFDHIGVIAYPLAKGSEDAMLELALDVGADECVSTEEGHEFLTGLDDFLTVREALEAKLGAPLSAAITWRPKTMVAVKDEIGESLVKLVEILDDHDDVQNVYGNYELSDALMAKLTG